MRIRQLYEMSLQDLKDAELAIEWLFKDLRLDVVWTNHFVQRVTGRESDVTKVELMSAFSKMKKLYGQRLQMAQHDHEHFVAVLKDLSTNLNIPFAVHFDSVGRPKYTLSGITIMRKDPAKFHTNVSGGTELPVA